MSSHAANASLERAVPVFAALGDPTRLRLVAKLASEGPLSITQLTSSTDVTRQAVTKHLAVLSEAGVVRDFRQGRERIWELETRRIEQARRALERVSARWDDALERLRRSLEAE